MARFDTDGVYRDRLSCISRRMQKAEFLNRIARESHKKELHRITKEENLSLRSIERQKKSLISELGRLDSAWLSGSASTTLEVKTPREGISKRADMNSNSCTHSLRPSKVAQIEIWRVENKMERKLVPSGRIVSLVRNKVNGGENG